MKKATEGHRGIIPLCGILKKGVRANKSGIWGKDVMAENGLMLREGKEGY